MEQRHLTLELLTPTFLGDAQQTAAWRTPPIKAQLRRWLAQQFPELLSARGDSADPGYEAIMEALLHAEPRTFQAVTAEALAWLRWVRQIAPTRVEERPS